MSNGSRWFIRKQIWWSKSEIDWLLSKGGKKLSMSSPRSRDDKSSFISQSDTVFSMNEFHFTQRQLISFKISLSLRLQRVTNWINGCVILLCIARGQLNALQFIYPKTTRPTFVGCSLKTSWLSQLTPRNQIFLITSANDSIDGALGKSFRAAFRSKPPKSLN